MDKVILCLWCDGFAEEMAQFYTGLLPDSAITRITHAPIDYPAGQAGDVITVEFRMAGRDYVALNGGADFRFSEAVSFQIICEDQAEVDHYWAALSAHPENEECGWLKDRFGLSWQIVPRMMMEIFGGPDADRAARVMAAMLTMKKLDIAALEAA